MPSGILLLDKPRGLSSNAALQRVRALFLRQKAGHVGSLDPLATGMLPICLGEATKIAAQILAGRKRYRFTVTLGAATATGDAEGAFTTTAPVPPFDRAAVDALLAGFRGSQTQIPPMYSALKRAGQPLYKLARAGMTVARAARTWAREPRARGTVLQGYLHSRIGRGSGGGARHLRPRHGAAAPVRGTL